MSRTGTRRRLILATFAIALTSYVGAFFAMRQQVTFWFLRDDLTGYTVTAYQFAPDPPTHARRLAFFWPLARLTGVVQTGDLTDDETEHLARTRTPLYLRLPEGSD